MSAGHVYCECEKAFKPAFKESSISPREIEVCGAVTFFVCVEEEGAVVVVAVLMLIKTIT